MRMRRMAAVVTVAAVTVMIPAIGAGAAPTLLAGGSAARSHTVTLITGDRVQVAERADGRQSVTIAPGPGRERIGFLKQAARNSVRVIPVDAARAVAAGRLDARLFDVSGLIRDGFDDSSRAYLPLIMRYGQDRSVPPGATAVRSLASIGSVAVHEDKAQAGGFWQAARSAEKIWLDGRMRPVDE